MFYVLRGGLRLQKGKGEGEVVGEEVGGVFGGVMQDNNIV